MPITAFNSFTDGLDPSRRSREHFVTAIDIADDRRWVPYVLKLCSDQTDSVSVDLRQQRSNGEGRLLSFIHSCGRLRSQKLKAATHES